MPLFPYKIKYFEYKILNTLFYTLAITDNPIWIYDIGRKFLFIHVIPFHSANATLHFITFIHRTYSFSWLYSFPYSPSRCTSAKARAPPMRTIRIPTDCMDKWAEGAPPIRNRIVSHLAGQLSDISPRLFNYWILIIILSIVCSRAGAVWYVALCRGIFGDAWRKNSYHEFYKIFLFALDIFLKSC